MYLPMPPSWPEVSIDFFCGQRIYGVIIHSATLPLMGAFNSFTCSYFHLLFMFMFLSS